MVAPAWRCAGGWTHKPPWPPGICWRKKTHPAKIKILEVDASGLKFCDGAGLALLHYLNMEKMTPDATVSVIDLEASLENIFVDSPRKITKRSVRRQLRMSS